MPRVRGKFKVGEITKWSWNKRSALVKLESVEGAADDALSLSSAAGSISIMITNAALVEQFPLDQHFDVEFTPVD
jgi:hypothetical protein